MRPHLNCILVFTFLLISLQVTAQDKLPIKFGKVTVEDFDVKSPLIDSNTNAVVVADKGFSEFIANTNDASFSLLFKKKRRVKVINKNGFDAATVSIGLYVSSSGKSERLESLDAYTYNLENGAVVSEKVERAAVFTDKVNKNWVVKKFTFPALKEGSIIEYSYEIKSDFFFNLQPWTFQDEYPVLWSEYEVGIPEFFRFVTLTQGYQQFATNKVERSVVSYTFNSNNEAEQARHGASSGNFFKLDGSIDYHTWVMKDVPGLKEEPFTTTINNSLAKIEFQLSEIAYPNTMTRSFMNSWQKVSESLMEDENFGGPITKSNGWLAEEVATIVKGVSGVQDKSRKIYEYVRDNFTCTNFSRYYTSGSLKDLMKNKSGTVADINILLIAMLRTQGIDALPVLLSTREHGFTNELYPLMDRYNYVVACVNDDQKQYFLDAATPRLGFNKLSLKAFNGQARIIDNKATPVYFVADSVEEANNSIVFITSSNGKIEGSYTGNLGYYTSLKTRNMIAASGIEEFKKELQKDWPEDIEISNLIVDSLKKLDEPVSVSFEMKLNGFGDADVVYFNPMLGEAVKKNPFAAAVRYYPVEMPYTVNDVYTLNMEIPSGYKVEELPKSARIMLNEDEGIFEYLISADESAIQMRCRLLIKKANFPKEDYQTLRDFYSYLVKKEAEQIVFKKIK